MSAEVAPMSRWESRPELGSGFAGSARLESPSLPTAVRRSTARAGVATAFTLRVLRSALPANASFVEQAYALHRGARQLCRSQGVETIITGAPLESPAVLVANHLSYLDPMALAASFPALPIAKGEVERWPLVGQALSRLGILFVRRGDAASGARVLKRAHRALRSGVSILNFPEGTTSEGKGMLPFKLGAFGLARLAGVPIVPIAVRFPSVDMCWIDDDLFVPHYFRTTARRRTKIYLHVGEPIRSRSGLSDAAFAAEARERLFQLMSDHERQHSF